MALSKDLINQFVKLTTPEQKPTETTVNGTYKKVGNVEYVQIDGSDILTPVESTVTADNDDRVQVLIKNHKAIITGNITSPSARHKDVSTIKDEVDEFGNTIKQMDNTITQQNNSIIQIDNNLKQVNNTILQYDNVINQQGNAILQMNNAIEQQGNDITQINNVIKQQGNQITSINNTVVTQGNTINQFDNRITQQDNTITQQGNIITEQGNKINLFDSNIEILNSAFKIKDGVLTGLSEIIVNELETNTLNAKYANIDFSNINYAAVKKIFSESGIIKDLIVSEGKITGELVGVTIKGDLIEGNTVKADKLVVKGSDGLYYKLNVDALGETTASSDEKYQNGLDGSVIIAKSITAEKVAVNDLVAFGATIGGFNITTNAIYSGVKESVNNTTRGIYMDKNGQFAVGDSNNFIKYFKDEDDSYKIAIKASAISIGVGGKDLEESMNDLNKRVDEVDPDAIQIGGRNLLLGTRNFSGDKWNNLEHWETWDSGDFGYIEYRRWGAWYGIYQEYEVEKDQQYTFSFYAKGASDTGSPAEMRVFTFDNEENAITYPNSFNLGAPDLDAYKRYSVTFTATANGTILPRVENAISESWLQIYALKLEKGNKPTDWTPAPEDIDSNIDGVKNKVETVEKDVSTLGSTEIVEGSYLTVDASNNPAKLYFHGNSKQETRSGKNYFDIIGFAENRKWTLPYTETKNGITITINENGSITISGTATSNIQHYLFGTYQNIAEIDFNIPLEQGKTYIASGGASNWDTGCQFILYDYDGTIRRQFNFYDYKVTMDKEGFKPTAFGIAIKSGTTVNKTYYLQIEEGSTATKYEQYGAIPSLDYPSEVESCGNNINIFDKDNYNFTNVYINANDTSKFYMNASNGNSIYLKVKPNKTYFLNRVGTFTSIATSTDIPTLDGIITNAKVAISEKDSITTGENDNYLLVFFIYGTLPENDRNNLLNQLKIVEETKIGEYSPYGQGCINEVICNKNLLPINVTEKTMYGITITKKSDGTYSLNGTATTSFTFDLYSGDYIKLPSGTYTGQSGQMLGFYIRKDSGDYQTLSETNKKTNTFTITEDFIYNRIYMYIFSGKTYNNTILTPMLEEGSIATEFEEHKTQTYTIPTQQPMRSVGDIRDEFVKIDDKWFERHYVARRIFNGTENWKKLNGVNIFYVSFDGILWNKEDKLRTMSNYFIAVYEKAQEEYKAGEMGQGTGDSNIYFTTNHTTVDDFKAWLIELYNNGAPLYVDYSLKTPLDIECTPEQQTVLDSIQTYKGINHIYNIDEIEPGNTILEYYPNTYYNDTLINKDIFDHTQNNITNNFNNRINEVDASIQSAQSSINILSNMISHLITDANGGSLMTQTSDGWTFNMSGIDSNLQAIQNAMKNMQTDQSNTNSALNKLTNLINDVSNKTAYITMAKDDNGNPCIELGKSDNPFKVRITNTAIDFLQGSTKIAYANNNTFYATKMIVKNELQIGTGPGFVWKTRANGNMGLVYIS